MSRVLVVEDEPDVRLMLRLALGLAGHEIEEAATGQRAIDALSQGDFGGVVLDIHLPDMTGWDVLDRLRASPRRDAIPVVVVTADISQADVGGLADAHRHLISALLLKPMDPDLLVTTIEAAMEAA